MCVITQTELITYTHQIRMSRVGRKYYYVRLIFNSTSVALQAGQGQLNFSAVYCGVLKRQTAAFCGQHLRQWRITITTMTGIGLTGVSVEEEGKELCLKDSIERACDSKWQVAGAFACTVAGDRAGVGRAAAARSPAMMNGRPGMKLNPHGLHVWRQSQRFVRLWTLCNTPRVCNCSLHDY